MTDQKRIPIANAKTGEIRYSEPMPKWEPRQVAVVANAASQGEGQVTKPEITKPNETSNDAASTDAGPGTKGEEGNRKAPKPKTEIATLEQFIAHAYGLKGRKLNLKPKVERQIAQDPRLSDESRQRLKVLSNKDIVFAVPRQLLLVARQVTGYPALRATIREFVRDAMVSHPLFQHEDIEMAVRNLDEALAPNEVLKHLASFDKKALPPEFAKPLKDSEFEQMRTNAVYSMAVWLADMKGLSTAAVTDMLFAALWAPKAQLLGSDSTKLGALTSISELGGVGLACEDYRRLAIERLQATDSAVREAQALRVQVQSLEFELANLNAAALRVEASWENERQTLQAQIEAMRHAAETESAHLRHDLEQQRTRLLRRLKSDVHMLEEGLQALRRPEPKVHVMVDHAERVTDALRLEINNLQGGE